MELGDIGLQGNAAQPTEERQVPVTQQREYIPHLYATDVYSVTAEGYDLRCRNIYFSIFYFKVLSHGSGMLEIGGHAGEECGRQWKWKVGGSNQESTIWMFCRN